MGMKKITKVLFENTRTAVRTGMKSAQIDHTTLIRMKMIHDEVPSEKLIVHTGQETRSVHKGKMKITKIAVTKVHLE
jgi:hypothetical protein